MSVFCDSSALVKLYADEHESNTIRSLAEFVVSQLARVEIPAALWRKRRTGELSFQRASVLAQEFEWDWSGERRGAGRFAVVGLTGEILESASHALAVHPLRASDAIQLASALAARAADPGLVEFACFDDRLVTAARAEGFRPIP